MHDPSSLRPFLATALAETHFDFLGPRYQGKVRDVYAPDDRTRILVATDRQSAFDQLWCTIPLKGQVLTQLSAWWFDQIADVMPHHLRGLPDPNVMVVKNLKMIPVEIIVRAYLTGSTNTSVWVNYEKGLRYYCGNDLPDGMTKNQRFADPIVTPTTKGADDELIDPDGIVAEGFATRSQWADVEEHALALFAKGQQVAAERGLILVDTKYEMGYDASGALTVADEVHTPDSSRYWIAATYEDRLKNGLEPESLDKEFFRLWLRSAGFDPSHPETKPAVTDDVRLALSAKYIDLYERMTGEPFVLPREADVPGRIEKNLAELRIMN